MTSSVISKACDALPIVFPNTFDNLGSPIAHSLPGCQLFESSPEILRNGMEKTSLVVLADGYPDYLDSYQEPQGRFHFAESERKV